MLGWEAEAEDSSSFMKYIYIKKKEKKRKNCSELILRDILLLGPGDRQRSYRQSLYHCFAFAELELGFPFLWAFFFSLLFFLFHLFSTLLLLF